MRESTLERRLVREVERGGGIAPKWVSPGTAGVPDRIVVLPEGRVVFVELKAPGKRPRPLQEWWAERLQDRGHQVYVIDSVEGIEQFIREVMPNEVHPTSVPVPSRGADSGDSVHRVADGDGLGLAKRYAR